jgi:hypothetical protein
MAKIIVIVIVIIVFYLVYSYFSSQAGAQLVSMHNARETIILKQEDLEEQSSSDYTFSIWFAVDNWDYQYGERKAIFERRNKDNKLVPGVYFDEKINNIIVKTETTGSDETFECSLENVPLQKWSNLIISVNDRNMELYLDGKLVKTCILSGVPEQATDSMVHITPGSDNDSNKFGFGGFVSNFRHIGKAINPREAWKIYKNGYGQGGMFSNIFKSYGLKFALTKNNREINKLEF